MTCRCLLPAIALLLLLSTLPAAPAAGQEVLTRAVQVRTLSPDRALAAVPVELEAVVGFMEGTQSGTIFIQDETGGTFFRAASRTTPLHVGDRVRLRGTSMPGLYLAGINASEYEVLGAGSPPAAAKATFDDLATGRYHYQLVQVEGIGRRVAMQEEDRSVLYLALGSRVVEVRVDEALPEAPESWVDARVQVTALAAGGINDRRQLVFPYLRISRWADAQVVKQARSPKELPLTTAASLLRFDPARMEDAGHRVRTVGVVLAAFPDGQIFLRDQQIVAAVPSSPENKIRPRTRPAALAVKLVSPSGLVPGQKVDVAGFPNMDGFSASLADAIVVQPPDDERLMPEPVKIGLREMMEGELDADLVQVEAVLADAYRTGSGWELRAVAGNLPLKVMVNELDEAVPLLPGSLLRLTGICRVESSTDKGFRSRPEHTVLWVRGPQDLEVLRAPSWWTTQRLAGLVSVLLAVVAGGLLWITSLRRQVTKQSEALQEKVAHEAVLEERQRIAREFHDTLEQELAGLSLRLDAATTRPLEDKAKTLLQTSRHLVSRIQSEARNLVADLRADPDAATDLNAALHELAEKASASGALIVRVENEANTLPGPLPAHVAHHLRMMAQESVTNVIKHARATQAVLKMECLGQELHLTITDDGQGLAAEATQGMAGHFGCMGMRERSQRIGANVTWSPVSPHGTQVRVIWPMAAPADS